MPRKRLSAELFVLMNGLLVGTLVRQSTGNLLFSYDSQWLQSKNSRPISLSMPLTETPYRGEEVNNFFDNLLPDSELIRERIQARFKVPTKRCFDLLSHIGADCVGALQLLTQPTAARDQKVKATPLDDEEIANLLKHYKTSPLGMAQGTHFRISIAGAQEKTALLWHQNQWQLPEGATPTSHIIKLPIGVIAYAGIDLSESVENEWLCLKILSAYGMQVAQASMVSFNEVKTLVVERFDRQWSDNKSWLIRLPQEDLCQALGKPSGLKYESDGGPGILSIMNLLRGAYTAKKDREQFMKSVFLFWVLGAIDGHAKNFSVHLEAGSRYRLTPLYDVMSAYPLAAKRQLEWRDLKMAMSLKSKNRHYHWHSIQRRHWLAMAEYCQFPVARMDEMIDEACDEMEAVINKVSSELPNQFPKEIAESIFQGMIQIKNRLIHKIKT